MLSTLLVFAILGWVIAILFMFFPIFWMAITAFKTEKQALIRPDLFFVPTLESFREVFARSNYLQFAYEFHRRLCRVDARSAFFLPFQRYKNVILPDAKTAK